ncbi:MAG: TIGR03086 family metal-binding protein [Actinomycetota bacterium]
MSQEHIDIWNQSADAFTQRYDAISAEQWNADTPCEGWCVQDLVDHAVGVQIQFAGGLVGAEIPEGADWPTARDAIRAKLDAGGALDGMTEMPPMGTVPKMVPFGIAASDLVIHTWDLARAIGADETLPPAAVAATHAGLQRFPPEAMRGAGMFGDEVAGADADDAQTQMLKFSGRDV